MRNWYIVIGRCAFDDEDTAYVAEARSRDKAVQEFRRHMWQQGKDCEFIEKNPEPPEHPEEDEDIIYVIHVIKFFGARPPKIVQTA